MIRRLIRELLEFVFGALVGSALAFYVFYLLVSPDPFEKQEAKSAKEAQCKTYKEHVATDEHIREIYYKVCLEGGR